ncbi:MAG: transposase [Defluviicoccus sp.]|nr:MAG: transposase [Defluviicoccus sp.]
MGGLRPLIPAAKRGGRPRTTDMRAALNAIFCLLRTGCPWRSLPRDGFPPRATVCNIFRAFRNHPARAMGVMKFRLLLHWQSASNSMGEDR